MVGMSQRAVVVQLCPRLNALFIRHQRVNLTRTSKYTYIPYINNGYFILVTEVDGLDQMTLGNKPVVSSRCHQCLFNVVVGTRAGH